jgi:exopolysaccharide biosynthesis protein
MKFQKEKKPKVTKKTRWGLMLALTVIITLIFIIAAVFFAGRAVASKGNEDLRLEFYTLLSESPFKGLIKYVFDDDDLPDTTPILPDCINSSASGITVSASASEDGALHLTYSDSSMKAHVLAIKDPSRLCMGKSTFSHNYISEIKNLENASYAFSAADDRQLNVTVSSGKYSSDADVTFFGITQSGILAFGRIKDFTDTKDALMWAQESVVHTLIHESMPTSFSPSENPIGIPTLSIGQCVDGSLLIVIADEKSSTDSLTKLFYKYSAVNAAIVYVGEAAGIIYPNGEIATFGEEFENAQYSHSWLIK